jgi:hypothetical protein
MRNDMMPPLLAVDLDQFIEPGRDGLLPQMANCRSSPVERGQMPVQQENLANLRLLRFEKRSAKSCRGGREQTAFQARPGR